VASYLQGAPRMDTAGIRSASRYPLPFPLSAADVLCIDAAHLPQGLLLLNYLLRNGSERVIESARDHLYDIRQLERFEFIDGVGKDQGINGGWR
jgi:hypothetical protein